MTGKAVPLGGERLFCFSPNQKCEPVDAESGIQMVQKFVESLQIFKLKQRSKTNLIFTLP